MMKKLTSILLALVMALTLCTAAWADSSVTPSYDWFDGKTDTYCILDDADLLGFANIANGTRHEGDTPYNFAGATVVLADNIDLGRMEWPQIRSFKGEFNGDDHLISGFKITDSACGSGSEVTNASGFFRHLENGAYIHDLRIDDVQATSNDVSWWGVGTLAGNVDHPNIKNVHVSNVVVTVGSAGYVGGLCARVENDWTVTGNLFTDCSVTNLTVNAPNGIGSGTIGGFVRVANASNIIYTNCSVDGFKVIVGAGSTGGTIGGFTAVTQTRHSFATFNDCYVNGLDITVAGNVDVGGFIGTPGARTACTNCSASGTINAEGITDSSNTVGGFIGNAGGFPGEKKMRADSTDSYSFCDANVNIKTGGATAGGFVADTNVNNVNSSVFANCSSTGDVTGTGTIGAFGGNVDRGTYEDCVTTGTANGQAKAFGSSDHSGVVTLTLNLDGGTGVNSIVTASGTTIKFGDYHYEKRGHCPVAWRDADGNEVQEIAPTTDKTLSVVWKANEYNITYKLDGGTNATSNPTKYTYGVGVTSFAAPTKSGHTFKGWVNSENVVVTSIGTDEIDGITLTATWEKNKTPYRVNPNATPTETVESPKTFDAGIAVYGVMAISSVLGMGYVGKKKF